jgi:hypothetical protein
MLYTKRVRLQSMCQRKNVALIFSFLRGKKSHASGKLLELWEGLSLGLG